MKITYLRRWQRRWGRGRQTPGAAYFWHKSMQRCLLRFSWKTLISSLTPWCQQPLSPAPELRSTSMTYRTSHISPGEPHVSICGHWNTHTEKSDQTVIESWWNVRLIFSWQESDGGYNRHTHACTNANTHTRTQTHTHTHTHIPLPAHCRSCCAHH